MGDFKVVIDYGHNIGAINATGEFINSLMPGKKIRMASGVGNRRKSDIFEFGLALSKFYDHVIICDSDPRERQKGETANIVKEGLLSGGLTPEMITVVLDEKEATKLSLEMARKDDVVVLQVDNIEEVIKDVINFKQSLV